MENKTRKPRVSKKNVVETEVVVEATTPIVEVEETITPIEETKFVEKEVIGEPIKVTEEPSLVDKVKVAGTRFIQRIFKG